MDARSEAKLDKIVEDIGEIKITMAVNTQSLQEHIKRTNILEKRVEPMWTTYKIVGVLAGVAFFLAAVVEVLGYFKH